jgi:hypothetical protein
MLGSVAEPYDSVGPLGPPEGGGVGGLGPIAVAAAVSGQLPRDR